MSKPINQSPVAAAPPVCASERAGLYWERPSNSLRSRLVRSPPCCRPPGSAAPPSPSWELKVTGGRKHAFHIKMVDMLVLLKRDCLNFRMDHLKNRIAQTVKIVQLCKPKTHTYAADLTLLKNTGREDVTELQLEKLKYNPPTHDRLNPGRMFTSSTYQTNTKNKHVALFCHLIQITFFITTIF